MEFDNKKRKNTFETEDSNNTCPIDFKKNKRAIQPFLDEDGSRVDYLLTLSLFQNDNPEIPQFNDPVNAAYLSVKTITKDIRYFKDSESLELHYNKIEEIPQFISHLENLKHLDLIHNKLKKFPSSILSLGKKLETLSLSENKIGEIPSDIDKLTELKRLFIADCDIKQLPPQIGNLNKLEELDIGKNQGIVFGDTEISYLQGLKSLYTRLNGIPIDKICKLKNLEKLELDPIIENVTVGQIFKLITELKNLKELRFGPPIFFSGFFDKEFEQDIEKNILQISQRENYKIINQNVEKLEEESKKAFYYSNVFQLDCQGRKISIFY